MKSSNTNYYNRSPYGLIEPGDIFTNLPTMGLLKENFTPGLIITPACDLANKKTETITYLPILSIKSWLSSTSFYPELVTHFHNMWNQFEELSKSPLPKQLPEKYYIELLKEELGNIVVPNKKKDVSEKIYSCLDLIDSILDETSTEQNYSKIKETIPKIINQTISRIVSNSYSSDLHFLLSETHEANEAFVLHDYSVVLFRFPITVPFEILDTAKDITAENSLTWNSYKKNSPNKLCYTAFGDVPLRGLRLNQEYLSDLLTRYVSLYIRIGSPDFDNFTYQEIIEKIEHQLQN